MKVGDIVKWCIVANDEQPIIDYEYGTVLRIQPGEDINGNTVMMDMVLVLFTDGTKDWIHIQNLQVISEA